MTNQKLRGILKASWKKKYGPKRVIIELYKESKNPDEALYAAVRFLKELYVG